VSQTRAGRPPRDRDEDGGGRRGDDGGRRDSFRADAVVPETDVEIDDTIVDVEVDDDTDTEVTEA